MLGHYAESNFNCTIQELKQYFSFISITLLYNFNCTIQELKHTNQYIHVLEEIEFQLHHTGIKTQLQHVPAVHKG